VNCNVHFSISYFSHDLLVLTSRCRAFLHKARKKPSKILPHATEFQLSPTYVVGLISCNKDAKNDSDASFLQQFIWKMTLLNLHAWLCPIRINHVCKNTWWGVVW